MKKSEIKAGVEYAYYKQNEYHYARKARDGKFYAARKVRVSQEALDKKVGPYDNKCAVQGWIWRKGWAQGEPKEFGWFPAELNIKKFQDEWDVHVQWVEKNIAAEQKAKEAQAERDAEWAVLEPQVMEAFDVDKWSVSRSGNKVVVEFSMEQVEAFIQASKERQAA